ncbi:hypothetical protein TSAR_012229 [Trichomalopsis sarcophagae]|uniref:Uncharacterized protein n=1 Tax=Trichomalopsis sarcophagae TaxID=543379 RepID=A0A232EPW2_9HYME|nr:hypothetical protein TSAR_012229 [Trichomalopsis sarcophagae]
MIAKALILLALVALSLAEVPQVEEKVEVKKHVEEEPQLETKTEEVADEKKHKRGLLELGYGYASPYAYSHLVIPTVYTQGVHTNTVITKEVPVAVPHPVAVPVEKRVPYPVIQKVAVPVDRPVAVNVPRPYPVEVTKHVPVPVDRPVAVPYPVVKHVPAPYAVPVVKHVPVPYAQPIIYEKYSHAYPLSAYTTWGDKDSGGTRTHREEYREPLLVGLPSSAGSLVH